MVGSAGGHAKLCRETNNLRGHRKPCFGGCRAAAPTWNMPRRSSAKHAGAKRWRRARMTGSTSAGPAGARRGLKPQPAQSRGDTRYDFFSRIFATANEGPGPGFIHPRGRKGPSPAHRVSFAREHSHSRGRGRAPRLTGVGPGCPAAAAPAPAALALDGAALPRSRSARLRSYGDAAEVCRGRWKTTRARSSFAPCSGFASSVPHLPCARPRHRGRWWSVLSVTLQRAIACCALGV